VEKEAVVADNTVLSNFALIGREDILAKLFKDMLFTAEEVLEELKRGEQRNVLPKRDWQWIKVLKIESSQKEFLFRLFAESLGKGESSCLSIAISRELKVLTDDKDARRLAQRRGVPISGTIGVLVEAVRDGYLSTEEGNTMLSDIIEKGYFSPFETLDGLI
jgi:predicted nucleic acid-binding protein